jgi:hypothetical protein
MQVTTAELEHGLQHGMPEYAIYLTWTWYLYIPGTWIADYTNASNGSTGPNG